jgi:hypothetical protein
VADERLKTANIKPAFPGMLETIVIADLIIILTIIKNCYFHQAFAWFDAHGYLSLSVSEKEYEELSRIYVPFILTGIAAKFIGVDFKTKYPA